MFEELCQRIDPKSTKHCFLGYEPLCKVGQQMFDHMEQWCRLSWRKDALMADKGKQWKVKFANLASE